MTNHLRAAALALPLMTMKAAALLALCSVKTIRAEIKRERLRAYRVGHKILIKADDFDAYILGRKIVQVCSLGGTDLKVPTNSNDLPVDCQVAPVGVRAASPAVPAHLTSPQGEVENA